MIAAIKASCYNQEGHRHGTPAALSNQSDNRGIIMGQRSLADRFQEKYIQGGKGECWEWIGAKTGAGYGSISKGRKHEGEIRAHRLSYMLYVGKIPSGFVVRHLCHNKLCVNPDHLAIGTCQDNRNDDIKNNKKHARHDRHPMAVLNTTQVKVIKEFLRRHYIKGRLNGVTKFLSCWFNVKKHVITNIALERCWKEV